MTAAILSIGTEITRGELVNTNASTLAEVLTDQGLDVTTIETIPDDRTQIVETLSRLSERHRVIVCTGGLGPTTDDLTSECVAKALGVELVRDEASLAAIRERMSRFGRSMAKSNEKQADFPAGARVLPNRKGTAPGFSVQIGRAQAFFMPGVPREMKTMLTEQVLPAVQPLISGALHQVRLKTFGMTESAVNDRLAGIEEEHGVIIGYRAHFPEIEVKLLARDAKRELAESRARAAADEVRSRLGPDVIYADRDTTFAAALGELLIERGLSLGAAESCTGGLVSELLTERGGASAFFKGSIVSYANTVKQHVLGVPEAVLIEHGAVSVPAARAMAEGARRVLEVDLALAITGIAGPTGGSAEKPVGTVCYAVSSNAGTVDRQMIFPGSRQQIRMLSAFAALALVRQVVRGGIGE